MAPHIYTNRSQFHYCCMITFVLIRFFSPIPHSDFMYWLLSIFFDNDFRQSCWILWFVLLNCLISLFHWLIGYSSNLAEKNEWIKVPAIFPKKFNLRVNMVHRDSVAISTKLSIALYSYLNIQLTSTKSLFIKNTILRLHASIMTSFFFPFSFFYKMKNKSWILTDRCW